MLILVHWLANTGTVRCADIGILQRVDTVKVRRADTRTVTC